MSAQIAFQTVFVFLTCSLSAHPFPDRSTRACVASTPVSLFRREGALLLLTCVFFALQVTRRKGLFACAHAECGKVFTLDSSLRRHQVSRHGRQRERPPCRRRSWKCPDKEYACRFPGCRKAYFKASNLYHHQRLNHPDTSF